MEVEFVIRNLGGIWEARCEKYLVILHGDSLEDLVEKIREWVKKRFPGENVRIVLKTLRGELGGELYVPGPARPIRIDPSMFRV